MLISKAALAANPGVTVMVLCTERGDVGWGQVLG